MKVSIMSPIIFAGSTVEDPAFTLDDLITGISPNCRVRELTKGLEVKVGTEVYEYQLENKNIPTFDDTNDYEIGEIVLYNCKLHKITGKSGLPSHEATRPKEPEEYNGFDDISNFENATHRYFRISNTHIKNQTMGSLGIHKYRWYYIFFEDRPHHPNCGYRFSAKDLNKTGTRDSTWYLRTCLKNATSYAYDSSKDFKAVVYNWSAPGTVKQPTLNCKNLIIRGNYSYLRTQLDIPVEYVSNTIGSTVQYSLTEVQTPMDIDGFIYKRNINALSVFDSKDYTKCESYPEDNKVSFSFYNTENFDCIALGKVIADTIDVHIEDTEGNSVFVLTNYPVYNDLSKKRFEHAVTGILYVNEVIETECLITVTLNGNYISLGDLSVGDTLDMGYTNLQFNNDYRDFSPFEQDQWGNILYKEGVKVKKYSGTVDLKISDYDMIYREMGFIGGKEVIINGSDSINNTPTNSISIFQATMMVGRFKSLKLKTSARANKIEDVATYSFEIEERV